MDGTLGLIWLLTSFTDMALNDCPSGCLDTEKQAPQVLYQLGNLQSDGFQSEYEAYLGYDSHRRRGPFRPTYGLSLTTDGAAWFGIGWKWSTQYVYDTPLFIETSMMPGVYRQGDGADLDGTLQFRSAFGIGYTFENGSKVTISYDSMSNADFRDGSPSRETLAIRWSTNWEQ